jgi:hypothetical protein
MTWQGVISEENIGDAQTKAKRSENETKKKMEQLR